MATYDIDSLPSKLKTGDIINCTQKGVGKSLTLPKGKYKLEVWGAQGGTYSSYYGGAGGYSVGTLTLNVPTLVYVYAGNQPTSGTGTQTGGFNGGGQGKYTYWSGTTTYAQAGGGGSDFRIGTDSLYARVIVAGGGGGSASVDALTTKYGGGSSSGCPNSSYIATQTAAGTNGSFGQGANGGTSTNYKYQAGGGGGGWYGGGANSSRTDSDSSYRNQNGGGSGYIYTSATASSYPSGCLLNSSYYLSDASTIAGNASMPSTSGSTETGHQGHGYCRITCIKISSVALPIKTSGAWKDTDSAYIKTGDAWKEIDSVYIKTNGAWKETG